MWANHTKLHGKRKSNRNSGMWTDSILQQNTDTNTSKGGLGEGRDLRRGRNAGREESKWTRWCQICFTAGVERRADGADIKVDQV